MLESKFLVLIQTEPPNAGSCCLGEAEKKLHFPVLKSQNFEKKFIKCLQKICQFYVRYQNIVQFDHTIWKLDCFEKKCPQIVFPKHFRPPNAGVVQDPGSVSKSEMDSGSRKSKITNFEI